jgi:hypothetical protein
MLGLPPFGETGLEETTPAKAQTAHNRRFLGDDLD